MIRRCSCILMTSVCALMAMHPASVQACAACYGQSDSTMAAGMNWGIISLLGMIVFVLGGVAGFFVFLIRKSAAATATQRDGALEESWAASWPVNAAVAQGSIPEALPRGGLERSSTLARQRLHCAPSRTTSTTLAARRSRS